MTPINKASRGLGARLAPSIALAATVLLGAAGAVTASATAPSLVWEACPTGSAAGQCIIPRGIAGNPSTGHIFIADQNNRRVNEFTAWGVFVKTWGWGVATGAEALEVCDEESAVECKAGSSGGEPGQFNGVHGVAVDSAGDVYVNDRNNHRVQKFDQEGNFILMFGGEVNKTKVDEAAPVAQQNLCTAASGDVCQAGSVGSSNGQFGSWRVGDFVAVDPADNVYVGDVGRIQLFDSNGVFQREIEVTGETVTGLDVDAAGNLYLVLFGKPDVRKINALGSSVAPGEFKVADPRGVVVSITGNVYAIDDEGDEVVQFAADGMREGAFAEGLASGSTGLGTNFCPDSPEPGNIYVSNGNSGNSFVRAYGSGPVGCENPPENPPQILDQYAAAVGSGEAELRGVINPRYWAGTVGESTFETTYKVQYGTELCVEGGNWEAPCVMQAPASPAVLDAQLVSEGVLTDPVLLTGLLSDTNYRFRFSAEGDGAPEEPIFGVGGVPGEAGTEGAFTTHPLPFGPQADCGNQTKRVGLAALLADCRAYEMVSPVDKNGGSIETAQVIANANLHQAKLEQATPEGGALTYSSKQPFGDAAGAPYTSQYIARRSDGGWSSHGISPRREGLPGTLNQLLDREFQIFSTDLSQGWLVHDANPPLDGCAPADSPTIYRRDNLTDSYQALTCEAVGGGAKGAFELQGASADGCLAVFSSRGLLVEEASAPGQLYESNCKGSFGLVGPLPEGEECSTSSSAGNSTTDLADHRTRNLYHALSEDGTRLYWTCGASPSLYLRSDPDSGAEGEAGEETVLVAAPFLGVDPPRFQMAAADGSRVLYKFNATNTLRAYDAEAKATSTIASQVEGITLGASEDARRVYFVSREALGGAGQNSEGAEPQDGQPNLYMHEATEGAPEVNFVGRLSEEDLRSAAGVPFPAHRLPSHRAARVSPDGLRLAFLSTAPITGYDNTDQVSGEPDAEVFRFDATARGGAGETVCVSCNPTGERPVGRSIGGGVDANRLWAAARIDGWESNTYFSRHLSDDGSRLFFESFEDLVLRDVNSAQDVYEWSDVTAGSDPSEKQAGQEECRARGADMFVPASGGCLSLISSGQDPEDSEFVDADADGSDVFFKTGESLVSADTGLIDIYDARVGGGFAPPPPPPEPCEGEACQSPPPAPEFDLPGSLGYSGPGNEPVVRPSCAAPARRARRLATRAKRLRVAARRAKGPAKARAMRRAARRSARSAKRSSRQAKRCRARARRAAGTSRRAGR